MQLSLLKRILSYIYPVVIRKGSGTVNPVLELLLFRDEWQLATRDALYSDGTRYRPLLLAFEKIKKELPAVKKVLLLGSGLGSAVKILDKMGHHPEFTLLDIDTTILEWAKELMPEHLNKNIKYICDDAEHFIKSTNLNYDLIIVDIFKGRVVPDFVNDTSFLLDCKDHLNIHGILSLNYMINKPAEWNMFKDKITEIFPKNKIYPVGINRIINATI